MGTGSLLLMVQPRKDNYFIFLFSPLKQGRRDPRLLRQESSAQGLSCSGQKLNARVFHGSQRALNVIWASSAKGCFQKLREPHETAPACSDGVEANHGPRTSDSVAKPLPKSTASQTEGLPLSTNRRAAMGFRLPQPRALLILGAKVRR